MQCLKNPECEGIMQLTTGAWDEVFSHLVNLIETPTPSIRLVTSCEKCEEDTFVSNLAVYLHTQVISL